VSTKTPGNKPQGIKAEVKVQDAVVAEVKELLARKAALETQTEVMARKVESIKVSLAENESLKKKNQELLSQVLNLFQEEWVRRGSYYPDIRQQILEKSASLNAPPAAKK
jgi:hypothetical protein